MMPHILLYEEIHRYPISRAGELLSVNDKIDALNNKLLIFLLLSLTWRCQLAQKVVWERHQLHVEIYVWRNKAFRDEQVQMRAIDELDHGYSGEYRGASDQTGIVSTDCGDIHVLGCILRLSLAQKTGFLSLLAKVVKSLQV